MMKQIFGKPITLNRYVSNTFWLMAERVTRLSITFLIGILVIRYLGPVEFGMLSYAISFVGIFAVISSLGCDEVVIKELVKNPDQEKELIGTVFFLKLFGTALMWVVISIVVVFARKDSTINILIAIVAAASIFQIFNVIDLRFQAKVRSKFVVVAQLTQLFCSAFLKFAFVYYKFSLIWFAFSFLFDSVIMSLGLMAIYFYDRQRIINWKWNGGLARKILHDSWPLIFSGVVVSIYMRIDQVMLNEFLGAREVGLYAAASRISEAWYFLPMTISASVFPAIIAARLKGRDSGLPQLQKLYNLMSLMAISIAIPITFFAPQIVNLLYGDRYIESATVLSIHVWAGVFVFLGTASSKWLVAEGLQIIAFFRTCAGMVVNIILNFILIPKHGIAGAAIATIAGQSVAAFFFDILIPRTREQFIMKAKSFNIIKSMRDFIL